MPLIIAEIKGREEIATRAGTHALSLLAVPLNVALLEALGEKSMPLTNLRRAAGSPPQTTMRGHLRALTEIGILEKRRQNDFPGTVEYELTGPGRELLGVAEILRAWLAVAPQERIALGSAAARSAIKALAEGWSSTLLRALAGRPLSLTELDRLIVNLSYPTLERRLGAMRHAGQIEVGSGRGRGKPYVVTPWLRLAIGPLVAATRWERLHIPAEASPIARIDIEAAFLLAVPLLSLPSQLSGSCRLAVESANGDGVGLAGVSVDVERGDIASCTSQLRGEAPAWAIGSARDWLHAVLEHDSGRLDIGGDCALAMALCDGLNEALLAPVRGSAGGD